MLKLSQAFKCSKRIFLGRLDRISKTLIMNRFLATEPDDVHEDQA
jgi:hypothetical protein